MAFFTSGKTATNEVEAYYFERKVLIKKLYEKEAATNVSEDVLDYVKGMLEKYHMFGNDNIKILIENKRTMAVMYLALLTSESKNLTEEKIEDIIKDPKNQYMKLQSQI